MNTTLPRPLRGIIPPMVTPLVDRDTLDVEGLDRLIEHILAGGVHGLFVLGTSGEGPSLSHRLRRELIDRVCLRVDGRVPVLVGITDAAFAESALLAEEAAGMGAAAVVAAAPYYFPAGQEALAEYFENLAAEVPLPLFLYNMPSHTKLAFDLDTVRRLIEVPNIAGVKDSSGDMIYFHQLCRLAEERPDWSVLIGPEQLLGEAVLFGGHGGVSGGANLAPRLYVDLYEAAAAGRLDRLRGLQRRVLDLADQLYTVDLEGAGVIKGLKCALACLGICDDFMAEPFHRFRKTERDTIRRILEDLAIHAPEQPAHTPAPPAQRHTELA